MYTYVLALPRRQDRSLEGAFSESARTNAFSTLFRTDAMTTPSRFLVESDTQGQQRHAPDVCVALHVQSLCSYATSPMRAHHGFVGQAGYPLA